MKLGVILIIVGSIIIIDRGAGIILSLQVGENILAVIYIFSLLIFGILPLYFGARRVSNSRNRLRDRREVGK